MESVQLIHLHASDQTVKLVLFFFVKKQEMGLNTRAVRHSMLFTLMDSYCVEILPLLQVFMNGPACVFIINTKKIYC